MLVLGIDPDLHNTGLALADATRVYAVGLVQVGKGLKGEDAVRAMCGRIAHDLESFVEDYYDEVGERYHEFLCVVEGQQLYLGGQKKKSKPEDLLNLANVTGAALAASAFCGFETLRPLPREWKGEVPKAVHQARTCLRYGWPHTAKTEYCIPNFVPGHASWLTKPRGLDEIVPVSNWKHAMDAVGLAYWGATKGLPTRA